MTKFNSMVLRTLVLGMFYLPKAWAVVPSPLSLGDENALEGESVVNSTSPRSVTQVAEKLAEDQHRLESVLQDLKEDQKALNHVDHKESSNGYSLH